MEITVLCKVVDNLGDIGFVARLCRALLDDAPETRIRLVVKGLSAFARIAHNVDETAAVQDVYGIRVFDWDAREVCFREFSARPPRLIVECFQCDYPDWLSEILFDSTFHTTVHIVSIEYLTAESWAGDFHLLKSGTRSPYVRKTLFAGGFTKGTAGLLQDKSFMLCMNDRNCARAKVSAALGDGFVPGDDTLKLFLFTYNRALGFLSRAVGRISRERRVCVFVAAGAGQERERKAFDGVRGVEFKVLPFLEQTVWDALLCLMDAAIVRGEDSFSRMCLLGTPFIWNIYPQDGEHHIVKLKAFLDLLGADEVRRLSFLFNTGNKACGAERDVLEILENEQLLPLLSRADEIMEQDVYDMLTGLAPLRKKFGSFAERARSAGDLSRALLDFLAKLDAAL